MTFEKSILEKVYLLKVKHERFGFRFWHFCCSTDEEAIIRSKLYHSEVISMIRLEKNEDGSIAQIPVLCTV